MENNSIKRDCATCDGCPMYGKGCTKRNTRKRTVGRIVKWVLIALTYTAIGLAGGALGHLAVCGFVHGEAQHQHEHK